MITITNNQGGEGNKLTVSQSAYETFYKRLGYTIVENKKEVSVSKADTPKEEIVEPKKEETIKPEKTGKVSKSKKISD